MGCVTSKPSTKQSPVEKVELHELHGHFKWSIDDFLKKPSQITKTSPQFQFEFPGINRKYEFGVVLIGGPLHAGNDSYDGLGRGVQRETAIYLNNLSNSKGEIRVSFKILGGEYPAGRRFDFQEIRKGQTSETWTCYLDSRHTKSGMLEIRCDVTICYLQSLDKSGKFRIRSSNPDPRESSMAKLLYSGKFSDFEVVCGDLTLKCHKAIVANKSAELERIVDQQSRLEIKGFDPDTVRVMLHHVYCDELPASSKCSTDLLLIADELKLTTLVDLCEEELGRDLSLTNAFQILKIAKQVKADRLKTSAIGFIAENKSRLIRTDEWEISVDSDPEVLRSIVRLA